MADTKIEWADRTWNPITGCTKISEACTNCYAERMSKRLAGRCGYDKEDPFTVTLHPDKLSEPLHWIKPSRIFVCSMGDLFHYEVPSDFLEVVFGIMSFCPQHTFMVLTKRPEQAQAFFKNRTLSECRQQINWYFDDGVGPTEEEIKKPCGNWPLPNVWLGVTAENQRRADERIPVLLQIPAAKRFVSIEPMLGPVDKTGYLGTLSGCQIHCPNTKSTCRLHSYECKEAHDNLFGIDWVICGGETGPGARPMHPDWVRSLRDQCKASKVPFFFKQWGEWTTVYPQGLTSAVRKQTYQHGTSFYGIDKKNAGRLLDGVEWNQFPEVRA